MKFPSGGEFEKPECGTHVARCYRILDLGTQLSTYKNVDSMKHKLMMSFELPECLMTGKHDQKYAGKPFSIHKQYTVSLHEKSGLGKDLQSWRGREFTAEEVKGFQIKKLLGMPAQVNLVESKEGFINIDSIAPVNKNYKMPPQVNPSVYFDLDEFDQAVFDSLSDKIKEKISLSPEYKLLKGEPIDGEEIGGAWDNNL